jgi:dethiobiotin synthetase
MRKTRRPAEGLIPRGRALAVVGTGTGVGKTVVTAALAFGFRAAGFAVSVIKPVASGGVARNGKLVSPDVLWLKRVLQLDTPLEIMNPVCYRAPLAPWVAGLVERRKTAFGMVRLVRRALDLLRRRSPGGIILVEGVGGVLVPLNERETVASLCARLGLPALVVGRAGLGTINHTWLSVEALRARGVKVAGVILNGAAGSDQAERRNAWAVSRLAGVKVIAVLPRVPGMRAGGEWRRALRALSRRIPPASVRALAAAAGSR